jgi:hypothetical protein
MIKEILKDGVLGKAMGMVYTIKFQKHGLPYCHIIIFLHCDSKLRTPDAIDSLISSELPDPNIQPELFDLVKKFMVHGLCGNTNPNAPCMKDEKCCKGFSKPFCDQTTISYTVTHHCNIGQTYEVNGKHNRWIVPYSCYLIWTYRCHINVECIASIKAIKYIYKYIYKGLSGCSIHCAK